jgi:ABC-type transporter Mla subunit MlaD
MRSWLLPLLAVTALAATVAACGGSSPTATEQWAGSVCTAMDDWATQINGYADDVRSQIQSPSAQTPANIQATVTKGVQASDQLAQSLKGLGAPPSSDGQNAKSLIDALATQVQQTVASVQSEAQALQGSSSATAAAASIATISADVSALVTEGKSTVESLQALNGELKDAFDSVDSCKQLNKDFG